MASSPHQAAARQGSPSELSPLFHWPRRLSCAKLRVWQKVCWNALLQLEGEVSFIDCSTCRLRRAEGWWWDASNCGHWGKAPGLKLPVITTITSSRTGTHNSLLSLLKLLRKRSPAPWKDNLLTFCWLGNIKKNPAPNLTSVYMSLLIHLIWIQPSFPPRIIHSLQKEVHPVASLAFPMMVGIRYSTKWWICQHRTVWFVCIPIRMDLSAEAQLLAIPNHYLKFSMAVLPPCWHWQILLVGSSHLSWRYLLILQHCFPFWATVQSSCWIHGVLLTYARDH